MNPEDMPDTRCCVIGRTEDGGPDAPAPPWTHDVDAHPGRQAVPRDDPRGRATVPHLRPVVPTRSSRLHLWPAGRLHRHLAPRDDAEAGRYRLTLALAAIEGTGR